MERSDARLRIGLLSDTHGLLRPEVEAAIALDATTRLREEDPFTGQAVAGVPTHVVPLRSRFEVDLNRAEDDAVYLRPEQSWGLRVWRAPPPGELVETSLRMHRAFYAMLAQLLDEVVATHGRFLLPLPGHTAVPDEKAAAHFF